MKKTLVRILIVLRLFGLDIKKFFRSMKGLPIYYRDFREMKGQMGNDITFLLKKSTPMLLDWYESGGVAKGHYFHQDLYIARQIYKNRPKRHIDIGSRVDGFVAHVAVYREIEVIDIRKIETKVENIKFRHFDLMDLPEDLIESSDSVSSLHVIEHFGLGRYSDLIDFNGHKKAFSNIARILQPKGVFYFSVPIGEQRIEFNAHRVFAIDYLLKLLDELFTVESFSYVDDAGDFHEDVGLSDPEIVASNYNCSYGCGIFVLRKK